MGLLPDVFYIKKNENLSSINNVILRLIGETNNLPSESFFGIDKNKKIKVSKMETHEI